MTKDGGSVVVGLTEYDVTSAEEVTALMEQGQANRAVGAHDMNEHSSRSHLLFLLTVEQSDSATGTVKVPRPPRRELHNLRYVIHIR